MGHNAPLDFASYSPDGKYIATTGMDHNIKIWEAATGYLLHTLPGHSARITKAKFSNSGKILASVSYDGTAKLWDAETGNLIFSLSQQNKFAIDVCFSPNDKELAVSGSEGNVKIWDIATGNLIRNLKEHNFWVYEVTYSSDGKYMATAAGDNIAKIFDAATGDLLQAIYLHSDYVTGISFSKDNKFVLTNSRDKTAKLFSVATGNMVYSFNAYKALFSADGKNIITINNVNSISIWDAANGLLKKTFAQDFGANDIAVNNMNTNMVLVTTDKTAAVFDIVSGKNIYILKGHKFKISNACVSPDGKNILTASDDGTAKIWAMANGALVKTLEGKSPALSTVLFNNANRSITTLNNNGEIQSWDSTAKLSRQSISIPPDSRKIKYSPDGKILSIGYQSGALQLWDAEKKLTIQSIKAHDDILFDQYFSSDGNILATISFDNSAKLWDVKTGRQMQTFLHDDHVLCGTFNKEASLFVTGSRDHSIKIWQTSSGKLLHILKGHPSGVNQIIFSKDEKYILSSDISLAILWNVETGNKLMEYGSENKSANTAVFSPEGKYIITGSINGNLLKYDMTSGNLLETINAHTRTVNKMECSADENFIVSEADDNTTKIWDSKTLQLKHTFNSSMINIDTRQKKVASVNPASIEIYDYPSFVKLYEMIPVDSGFITVLPDGYYRGEKNSASKLYYVKGLKTINFEQLDVKYNRPDKVLEAAGGSDTSMIKAYKNAYIKRIKKLGIDTLSFKPGYSSPEAEIINQAIIPAISFKNEIKLHIRGMDSLYLIDRFNIWINEVPVFGIKGCSIRNKKTNTLDTSIAIKLSQGDNRIEIAIANTNGTQSYRSPLFVKYTPVISVKENIYFIGIGINQFADTKNNLLYSVKDIRDLALQLKKKYNGNIHIDTLFDENVTKENIITLKKTLLQTNVNDKVIISYSGHGLLSKELDYYLSTYAVNFTAPEQNGLPYDAMENLLDQIPARKKLLLIDACHSGEVDKDEELIMNNTATSPGLIKGVQPLINKKIQLGLKNSFELMQSLFVNAASSTGSTIISASAGTQFALERNDLKNGVFTYSILEFLKQQPGGTITALKNYVNKRVVELTNGMQVPTTRTDTKAFDWKL